jgi:hypothetical protein
MRLLRSSVLPTVTIIGYASATGGQKENHV